MAVFRVERTRDYTVMCNHHLKDSNLSLKAKGLLSMMLSLPDEWNYTTRGLAAICKEGVDAIGKTLKELELAGYIIRRQLRGKDGRISDTEYTIFEKPRKPSSPDTTLPDTENPYLDNPDTEAPDTDNPAQLNTKKSNGRTLNIGRVMSPTLALLVQREAEISAFVAEPFYTVQLDCGFPAATGRMKCRKDADAIVNACKGKTAAVKSVERKEKSEKAPALYDLTSLQRDANRVLGYTSQQTLDYLQALYEKKLCTYPRTDSRYLTDDMEGSVPGLVAAAAAVCGMEKPPTICAKQVCSSKKVTDHHAIVPTISAEKVDMASLPLGEREVLKLAARGLLRAVDEPHRYAETVITVDCAGQSFTAKGKTVLAPGWKRYEQEQAEAAPALPVVTENQTLSVSAASVKTGKTTPPKHFTEDTLLAAMENAGKEDMPDDAERKGIGTPATRSGIIEKLVSSGFVERRKSKKITNLLPTSTGTALITVLPEQLQSPQLTAEWEHRLKEIERGEIAPDSFMDGIAAMLNELVQTYKPIPGTEVLFPSGREVVGSCPRCGAEVTESPKGFFCENRACSFVLWKNSRFFTAKKKVLTKSLAAALLKNGRAPLKGCYSEKTGKTYDASVLLEDDGQRTGYKLVFDNG